MYIYIYTHCLHRYIREVGKQIFCNDPTLRLIFELANDKIYPPCPQ